MDKKLVESYLDSLAELVIDENKIVTYKSLSRSLGIHVNTAKQLLYTYLSNEKSKNSFPISVTYLLAGKLQDGSINICIVKDDDLKNTYSKFVELTSEHVYSIQKCKNLKELRVLCGTDKGSINVESPAVIKCSKSVLKKIKEDRKSANYSEDINKKIIDSVFVTEKETRLQEANKKSESCARKGNTIKSPILRSPSKQNLKGNSAKIQADIKKPIGNIANLFAKAAQRNTDKSVTDENFSSAKKQIQGQTEPSDVSANAALKVAVGVKAESNSSGKCNESKNNSRRNKTGIKRKRIQMFYDIEDSDGSNEEEKSSEEEASPLSTVACIEDDKEERKESLLRNKRKKRKVIDRTVMNEDGYLETKKEEVFETDSENEVEDERKADFEKKKTKIASVSDKGKDIPSANAGKKQSSLLTFFKKS